MKGAVKTLQVAFSLAYHDFIWIWTQPLIGFCQMLGGSVVYYNS